VTQNNLNTLTKHKGWVSWAPSRSVLKLSESYSGEQQLGGGAREGEPKVPPHAKMKIAANARWLERTYTGIGQYTLHLFRQLAKDHPKDTFTLVVRKKIKHKFPKNIHVKVIPEKKWLLLSSLKKGYWEHCQLRKYFSQQKFDLIHFTYPAYPLCGISKPAITTIHDIIPWEDKRYNKSLRSKIYFWLTKKALRKCPQFIAVSETTKNKFSREFKIPSSRITVTYEAVSPEYSKQQSALRTKNYGLGTTLIYVGGYDPRKNVEKLIKLLGKLNEPDLTLVLAGGKIMKNKFYNAYDLQKSSKKSTINILKTGFVSEKELGALYRSAVAVINISENEGFNLPLLEAGYTETPIITSDIPVHRELYEGHAILLPLNNNAKALKTLKQFIHNPNLQEKYKKKASKLKEKYTWEKSAKKTYESYQKTTHLPSKQCLGSSGYI